MNKLLIFLAGLLLVGAQLGINFYITALPLIAFEMGASEMELVRTMYYYLIPYGIIGIFLAPLTYNIGFKFMAILGLGIYFFGTLIIVFANNIEVFCFARVIQGCGGGILSFMVKMILHRSYKSIELNMAFSSMEMIGVLTPALSPLISGLLLEILTWQELFVVLLFYILFASSFIFAKLPNFKERRQIPFVLSYYNLIRNKVYVINLFKILLAYMPILVCLSSLSFVFQGFFKVSPKHFGLLMLLPVIFLFLGSYSSKLANRYNFKDMAVQLSSILILASGIAILFLELLNYRNIVVFAGLISSTYYASGIIMPNSVADALNSIQVKTGAESSFIGFFQLTGSSIFNFWISTFISDFFNLILSIFITSGLLLLILNKIMYPRKII